MGDLGPDGPARSSCDTYGGYAPRHGGGAFSGKDPTKVDRSAAYGGRYAAKNIVAAGLARRCEIELAYAIGVAHPVSLLVDTFGTGALPDDRLAQLVLETFDLRPGRHHRHAGSAPAHLPPDRSLRSLRPHGCRPALGAHRPRPASCAARPGCDALASAGTLCYN